MKIIRNRWFVCLLALMTIGVYGCMSDEKKNFEKGNSENRLIEYMNQKYEDTFEFKAAFGGGAGVRSKKLIVSSQLFPTADIYVVSEYGSNECTDNYLSVKYKEETRNVINDILLRCFSNEFFLYYAESMYACPNEDGQMTFKEYICNAASDICFTVVVKGDAADRRKIEEALEKAITDAGMCCSGRVVFTADSIENLSDEKLSAYLFKKTYSDSLMFEMKDATGISELSWEKE